MMKTGTSNASPKTSISRITIERYSLKSTMLRTSSGVNPSRSLVAFGRIQ